MVQKAFIGKNALTGGTLDSLDGVDGAARGVTSDSTNEFIQLGDIGIVVENDTFSLYQYQSGTGTSTVSPNLIVPAANPVSGYGWVLTGLQIANDLILHENDKYYQGITVAKVVTDLIGMNASDQIEIGDGNIIVDGVDVHIPTGNFAVGNVATTDRFYSLYDSAANYAGKFYNTNVNGNGLEARGGSLVTDNALRVADYLNNDLLRVRGNGVITNRYGAVNNGLSIKYLSGGSDAIGVSSVGYFSMGDDTTMTDAILTVKNAGNRGNKANAVGSSLFQALFNDGVAFEIDKNGNVGIGNTPPDTKLHVYDADVIARIQNISTGGNNIIDTMPGVELITAGLNGTTERYATAIKFMSNDPNFTSGIKMLAGIFPRATESYSDDTKGGMAIDFNTTSNTPGAGTNPSLVRMTINQNGNVAIGATESDNRFYTLFDSDTYYAGLFYNTNALGHGLEIRGGSTNTQAAFRVADYLNNELMLVRGGGGTTFINQVGVNTGGLIPAAAADADDLIIGDGAGNSGLTIFSVDTGYGSIYWSGSAAPGVPDAFIEYFHSPKRMNLGVDNTVRISLDDDTRITNRLAVNLGTAAFPVMSTDADALVIGAGGASTGLSIYSSTTSTGNIYFADDAASPGYRDAYIQYDHLNRNFDIGSRDTLKIRIDDDVRIVDRLAVNLGTAAFPFTSAGQDDLVIGVASDNHGITVLSGSASTGSFYFADSASGDARKAAGFNYSHSIKNLNIIVEESTQIRVLDGNTRFTGHVIPHSTAVYDLGIVTANEWRDLYIVNAPTVSSDKNTKKGIDYDNVLGVEFISKLKPVTYKRIDSVIPESVEEHNEKVIPEKIIEYNDIRHGFIAQDVAETLEELGVDLDTIALLSNPNEGNMGLIYTEFIPPIVSTIHSLQADIAFLKSEIEKLRSN